MTSTYGAAERLQKFLAAEGRREHLVVQVHLGQARDEPEHHLLDGRERRGGDRHRVAVAAHALRDPQDVKLLDPGRGLELVVAGGGPTRFHLYLPPTGTASSNSSDSTSSSSPATT